MTEPLQSPGPEFAALAALLSLIADPKATAKRLAELQQQTDAAAKAQSKLDADRAAHEQKIAADGAELAAREAKVTERLYKAMRLEAEPPSERPEYFDPFPFDPNLLPGTRGPTGIARHKGDE